MTSGCCSHGLRAEVLRGRHRAPNRHRLTGLWGSLKPSPMGRSLPCKRRHMWSQSTPSPEFPLRVQRLVVLPQEIDLGEYLGSDTTTFFNYVHLQYSTVSELHIGQACQSTALCHTQYSWYEERGNKVSAQPPSMSTLS